MNHFFKTLCLAGSVSLLFSQAEAQQSTTTTDTKVEKEIIIRKKTDADTKVTIEINGDQVKVNGKPLEEFDDKNIDIDLENIRPRVLSRVSTSRSPFRGGTLNFNSEPLVVTGYGINSNRALLGVTTEKTDEGTKVKSVTKNSAAEKAGIKVGDLILKINDSKIATPEELANAIAKFKPEDKVDVRLKRDKKEQSVTATLAKPASTTVYNQNYDFQYKQNPVKRYNGNLNLYQNGQNPRVVIGSPTPRLGIKAQDTEDGKGVKVLGVDENSAAQKAGIKEGDLITEFEGQAVNDATELMRAAYNANDKNNMKLKLIRDGKSQDMVIKIPKKLKTQNL